MFRKLVANLPFSPALVGQLGFYAKRLKQEEAVRRIGLIFTALALIVQSLAVFSPPESANASNPADLIRGGISSKQQLLSVYDQSARGNGDLKKIFDYAGITRAELAATTTTTLNSRSRGTGEGAWLSWGRVARFGSADGEVKHNANGTTVYSRPLWRFDSKAYTKKHGSNYKALTGTSAKMGTFAILYNCGNLVSVKLPKKPTPPPKPPAPSPAAACKVLTVKRIDRISRTLHASAEVKNNAKITGYAFRVRDSAGKTVASQDMRTASTTASSRVLTLAAGTYTASVTVKTSVGDRTSTNCSAAITITPPEVCPYNPQFSVEDSECQPCPDNDTLWYKDEECKPQVAHSKSATNLTQNNVDATTVSARSGDRIQFTITAYNVGKVPATVELREELADTLEYATLQDNGTAQFDDATKTFSWGSVTLQPGEQTSRNFVVIVKSDIPATPQGASDPSSYDCVMTNAYGNTINIDVSCPTVKAVEGAVTELPSTGPGLNMLFAGITLAVVTYFYARSRQMGHEVRLIRKEFNSGTL